MLIPGAPMMKQNVIILGDEKEKSNETK